MRIRRARLETVLRALVYEIRAEKLTFLAGSIAYHAFISILPLLLLVLTVVQRTQNVALQDSVIRIMEAVLTSQASEVLRQGLADADTSVSVLGIAFLLWGSLRIFRGLDTAFSDIYETEGANTILDQLGDGLVLLVTVGAAIVGVSLLRGVVTLGGDGVLTSLLGELATAGALFVVFYPMYYIFPDTDVTAIEIVPGTAFAAVGLTVAKIVFTAFKAGTTGGNLIASILVLLTWLYVMGLIVLLGVAINAVLSNRSTDIDIAPIVGGVAVGHDGSESEVTRSALLDDLDDLAADLGSADGPVTVTVGDREYRVARPGTATVDRSSAVFGLDASVGLTLRWWPEDDT